MRGHRRGRLRVLQTGSVARSSAAKRSPLQSERMQRDKPAKEVRDWLGARCAQILATYREKCSENAPIGQLILPEALKLLPLYSNCIMKHDALCGAQDMSTDDRSWIQVRVVWAGV